MSTEGASRRGQQRSVAELLAAYSGEDRPPPRRRRREDEADEVGDPPAGANGAAGYDYRSFEAAGYGAGGRDADDRGRSPSGPRRGDDDAAPGYGSFRDDPSGYGSSDVGSPRDRVAGRGPSEYGYGASGYGSSGSGSRDVGSPDERSAGYGSSGYGSSGYGSSGYGSTGYESSGYGSTGYGSAGYGSGSRDVGSPPPGSDGQRRSAYGPPGAAPGARPFGDPASSGGRPVVGPAGHPEPPPPPLGRPDAWGGVVPAPPAGPPGYAVDPSQAATGYYPGYGRPPGRSSSGNGASGWYGTEPPPATEALADPRAGRPAFGMPAPAGPPASERDDATTAAPTSAPTSAQPSAAPAGLAGAVPTSSTSTTALGPNTAASPAARPAGAPEPRRAADGGPPTAASAMDLDDLDDDLDDDELDEVSNGPGARTRLDAAPVDRPAGLDADDDLDDLDDEVESRGGVREWLVMIAQLVLGALVGAVLWTVFSYLWQKLPVVALFLAAAATTGLVFGVRAMRRSDDLQTTVWAVVVGLVVTVSPAAFVLLSKG